MRNIIIASHGNMATGVKETIGLFLQQVENIHVVNAYIDDSDLSLLISNLMKKIPRDEELIILTDMISGSVTREFLMYLNKKNIHLIAGFNLSLILEIITYKYDEKLFVEDIKRIIDRAKQEMILLDTDFMKVKGESNDNEM